MGLNQDNSILSNAIKVSSTYNVGIGTSSPKLNTNLGTFLTIDGGASGSGWLELSTSSTTDGLGGSVTFNNNNIVGSDKRNAQIVGFRDGANNSGALSFLTWNAGTPAERMRITSTGDVGIGNTAFASTRLTITGKSNTSSDFSLVCNNSSNNNLFLVRNDGAVQANGPVYRYSGQTVIGGSLVNLTALDMSSSRTYIIQIIPTNVEAGLSYRIFGVIQANATSGTYAFSTIHSQTMDVAFSGTTVQARVTNGQSWTFNWSITQLL